MNLLEVNELVSVSDEIWIYASIIINKIRTVMEKINVYYNGKDKAAFEKNELILIKYQGKLASRTMIDPVLTSSKRDVGIDLIAEFQAKDPKDKKNIDFYSKENISFIKKVIKKSVEEVFSDEDKIESKEGDGKLKFYFTTKTKANKNLTIKLEFVVAAIENLENKNRKTEIDVIDLKRRNTLSSDSLALIDLFNAKDATLRQKYRKDFNLRAIIKILKALQYAKFGKQLVDEMILINQVLYCCDSMMNFSWKKLINSMLDAFDELNENGYILNYANTNVNVYKNKEFDYKKLKAYFAEIALMSVNDMYKIINDYKKKCLAEEKKKAK